MVKYGFRVGIFENMKIDRKGNWISVSKENEMRGKFSEKEVLMIKKSGLLKLKAYNITNTILKYTKSYIHAPFLNHYKAPFSFRQYPIFTFFQHDAIPFSRVF
jgi:hypothetical protein